MNLFKQLEERENSGNPVRVGIIGAGKFATMFMAQILRTPGMRLSAVCDVDTQRAQANMMAVGFGREFISRSGSLSTGQVALADDVDQLISKDSVDVVIESTGDPIAGTRHCLQCISAGIDVIMVNVEADALVGAELARQARQAGVVYSLAYGDQPALIAELVDAVRTMGLAVVCAGKGTKYLPEYHYSTPDTVWNHYGLSKADAVRGGMNSKMFNSFLDGTKSAIEMAAVANTTALAPPIDGLRFPPCSVDDLASLLRPQADGGLLPEHGMVEVVSSLARDGAEIKRDLRWGVYVVFDAGTEYVKRCFMEYGLQTDESGRYSALYRPYHLIGLELGVSVASVALRKEPTGQPRSFISDVVSIAKRDLRAGECLDGEGGATVWGRLTTAERSLEMSAVPIGLASRLTVRKNVAKDCVVTWNDVEQPPPSAALDLRRDMDKSLRTLT